MIQVALNIDTLDMPMGHAGFLLPATIMCMTLTTIRLGFRASGLRAAAAAAAGAPEAQQLNEGADVVGVNLVCECRWHMG